MKNYITINTPVGILAIAESDGFITHISIYDEKCCMEFKNMGAMEGSTSVLRKAAMQLKEYFDGNRKEFDLPLNPQGTEFQKKDWKALTEIPYGTTVSYKDIAEKIGCPKGFRAVGMANNRNPIMIVIPCHRVIGSDGSLVGYEGGIHIKEALLKLEGAI